MTSLVTGANGHLGNTLVRLLAGRGEDVRAGVRNTNNRAPFEGVDCSIVHADLLKPDTLREALQGVDVLYQVGAVFQRWATNPEQDIIQANITSTSNVLQAAAVAGVQKIVYVSSIAALDTARLPFDGTTWNPVGKESPYPYSKTHAERRAHELAAALGLDVVYILPGAIIGPYFHSVTPTIRGLIADTFDKKIPLNPNFHFLSVDSRDVAEACRLAAERGQPGERYVISEEEPITIADIVQHLQTHVPHGEYRELPVAPQWILPVFAWLQEIAGRLYNAEPQLTMADLKEYRSSRPRADTRKMRNDLGLRLRPRQESLHDTFTYLQHWRTLRRTLRLTLR
jgi:dihydroflavonol-4-reductase